VILTRRGGAYYRVANPSWVDPLSTEYSKQYGGRWNPRGVFGALYLNATIEVAAANARWKHRDRAIKLFDLKPSARPVLITVEVAAFEPLDVVSDQGVTGNGFSAKDPDGASHTDCQRMGVAAFDEGIFGVACRSAAEAMRGDWLGEELALFDTMLPPVIASRRAFADWYPDSIP
jgi:RES domain-containing protein